MSDKDVIQVEMQITLSFRGPRKYWKEMTLDEIAAYEQEALLTHVPDTHQVTNAISKATVVQYK